ncbi:MAG: HD domain-containing protein [Candidatus Eremiobacteraeota bacterium]|nr:HD domain-containing protein [Candidatus Eremiobacteraeota bacterium]
MKTAKKPLDLAAVFPEINTISDAGLREKVVAVWNELWEESSYDDITTMPTSPEIPYPHVPHNRCVLAMALAIAEAYERFHGVKTNRDVLIAAALLQDASKLVEMRGGANGSGTETTTRGKAYPHAFYGAHVALKHGIPDEIVHIILTHSPQAAKFPASLEGKILYYADQLDVIAIYKDRWIKDLVITK